MSLIERNLNLNEEESESQNKSLKRYLMEGNTITSLESWYVIECSRLASRVDDLHKMGVPVKSVSVTREAVKDENGKVKLKKKRFSAYYLEEGIRNAYNVKDDDIPEIVRTVTERRINER